MPPSKRAPSAHRIRKLLKDGWTIGFHGSSQKLNAFSDEQVGGGGDANSSLGLFLTYLPEMAVEYSTHDMDFGEADSAYVHVVCFPLKMTYKAKNRDEFYGWNPEDGQFLEKTDFAQMRQKLIDQGYDSVEFDDGDDSMAVVLRPSVSIVLAAIPALDFDPDSFEAFSENVILNQLIKLGLILSNQALEPDI